ncbi:hypothetical protein P167DRAFT_562735 [Morchella conica CCBAS932]|uniref:GATA-type domain-containing protein n=1 Tax=Morchella conica CCBAS932 TaxID=1392247 RepID=A0A3N4LD48_9PEZI|nr:hypothetical protein P167DRAFT_562735 [Morchella conica CCBAS932]
MSSSAMATPPGSSVGVQGENQPRSMRLKVAYTFDDESKSNCLARYPHPINSRAIQIDKDLLVGAVEFKTCILSMISSSPELVANLSQDYSVYAYDYSEQGIPLVGCGLLSWAMTAVNNPNNGSDNPAPARHIITGRISCNNFGFFSNDETFTQAQFVQSVHTYNALSKVIPGGFNASAWTTYLNQHPNILAPPTHSSSASEPSQAQSRTLDKSMLAETEKNRSKKSSRDGNATSSEENGEPPKKKVRNYSGRPRKPSGGPRKKATAALPPVPLSPIPELFTSPMEKFKEPLDVPQDATPQPVEVPAETTGQLSISFNAEIFSPENENSPAPQTVNSTIMASSPPIAPEEAAEETNAEFSPEPTSPVLPSLPPNEDAQHTSQEYHQDVESLFEDPNFEDVKPDVANIGSPFVEPPARPPIPATDQETALLTALKFPTINRLSTLPDDMTETAAPSPSTFSEAPKPKPKPKRKYPKKAKSVIDSGTINSDAVASSDIGEDGGRKIKRSKSEKAARTAANVKERIHAQMLAAIEQGKMPNFCVNCGAIETPTWRKVSTKDESEEAEAEGDAKSKKDKDKDLLLCNPCGLWYGSHKTMRPQDYWDGKKEEPTPKRPRPKKKKALLTPAASSQAQNSEVCIEPIVVPDEDEEELPMPPPQVPVQKRHSMTPKGNRSVRGSDPDWEAASVASRRVVQSSPAKRGLSADSPIDLEADTNIQSPRRLLFPVKVIPNCSSIRKTLNPGNATHPKGLGSELEKENRVPDAASPDNGSEDQQLATPIKKRGVSLQPRTPLSSPMKPGKLISPSPWNADIFAPGGKRKACGSLIQATPKGQTTQTAVQSSLSPTSQLLEKIMTMADPMTLPLDLGAHLPDDLPRLSPFDTTNNFDFGDNIFETDMTMPSSPPPLFNLGDGMEDEVNSWGGFLPSSPEFNEMDYGLDIFEDMGIAAPVDGESMKSEKSSSAGTTPEEVAITVDFSSYIDEATKNLVANT